MLATSSKTTYPSSSNSTLITILTTKVPSINQNAAPLTSTKGILKVSKKQPVLVSTPSYSFSTDSITENGKAAKLDSSHMNPIAEQSDGNISFGIRSFTVEISSNEKLSSSATITTVTQANAEQTLLSSPTIETSSSSTFLNNIFDVSATKKLTSEAKKATYIEQSNNKVLHQTISSNEAEHSTLSLEENNMLKSNLNILFNDNDAETTALNEMKYNRRDSHKNEIHNEIKIENKSQNGLYRIKIGEIATDEYDNGLHVLNELEDGSNNMKDVMPSDIPIHHEQPKVNIDDFFPSKIEDFKPIIEISNEKILKQKNSAVTEYASSQILQDIDANGKSGIRINTSNTGTTRVTNIEIELIEDTSYPNGNESDKKTQNDEVITQVENIVTENLQEATKISTGNPVIPKRSKKFDPSIKSNTQGPLRTHDFGMTKFSLDKANKTQNQLINGKPEFSTTKFYNSKELYSEILHKIPKSSPPSLTSTSLKTTVRSSNPIREKLLDINKVPIETSRQATTLLQPAVETSTASTIIVQTSHPRILTRLEEKLNTLDCDIQNLSADSTIWRGNETHELNLPITVSDF